MSAANLAQSIKRISDLVNLKKKGAAVTCSQTFEVIPVDFQHRKSAFRAHIFLCRFEGEVNGEKYKQFYGMSSETAMNKYVGGVANYRASEGKTVEIPFRGSVENTIHDILGGLRSACTYVGAKRLKELTKRTTFIRVQEQHNQVFSK